MIERGCSLAALFRCLALRHGHSERSEPVDYGAFVGKLEKFVTQTLAFEHCLVPVALASVIVAQIALEIGPVR